MFPGRHQIVLAMTDEHANVQLLAGAHRQACFNSLKRTNSLHFGCTSGWRFKPSLADTLHWWADKYLLGVTRRLRTDAPPDLDAFDAEAQGGRGAERLPPLHVSGLEDSLLGPFLLRGGSGVHRHHLVIHVLPQAWTLPGFFQFLLQVCPGNYRWGVLHHWTWVSFL